VSSISSSSARVAPQPQRAARRLAGFLETAAELFAEVGFEGATMQAIAERSGSSIGALYNYFPDKQSVAVTLLARYSDELRACLESLITEPKKLTAAQFAGSLIDRIAGFAQERPAWLNLHAASIHYRRDPAARRALRSTIANAFRTKNPSLSSGAGVINDERRAANCQGDVDCLFGIRSEGQTTDRSGVPKGAYLVSRRGSVRREPAG
jgi:AcrR family transcriptional regulator